MGIVDETPTKDSSAAPHAADAGLVYSAVLSEFAKASPKILIALCIIVVVALLHQPITALLDRSTEIGLGPLTVKAAEAKLKQINFDLTSQARYFSSDEIKTLTERYSHVLGGGKRANVLWVDDDPQNNKQMVDFLDVVGVTVVFARSYSEAVLRLEERSFDVVVSDWDRPEDDVQKKAVAANDQFWGSGAQLGRLLANSGCGRKVILFSSGSTEAIAIPPGVAAQTNNRYQLLLEIADGFRDEAQGCHILRTNS